MPPLKPLVLRLLTPEEREARERALKEARAAMQMTFRLPGRFRVEQLSGLGPWQIRELGPGSASRIIATCPDREMADAIAKFLNDKSVREQLGRAESAEEILAIFDNKAPKAQAS